MEQRRRGHAAQIARVDKASIPVVLVKCVLLVSEIGDDQIWKTVVVVVRKIDAHTCIRASFPIHGILLQQANLLERSVASVVVEKLHHRIVGDKDIRVAIPVVIRNSNPQPFARLVESDLRGNLRKASVPVIVINKRSNRRK